MNTTLDIQGMHCNACVERLRGAFEAIAGVKHADVTLSPPRAEIESDAPVSIEALAAAARGVGNYTVSAHASHAPVQAPVEAAAEAKPSLYPLILIVAYILGTVLIAAYARGAWHWHGLMNDFMAGFFLVFSFFKLLDLRGFVSAYAMYDVVARRIPAWGWVYPFVELGLGLAYLTGFQPVATNIATLVLMLVGAAGVLQSLAQKRAIRCACLGTALNLPMTTVTLVEDLGMAAMSAVMLVWML